MAKNHDPSGTWDPVIDYQMMSRNLRGFMSLFHANKPVVCKVHGFCVAGGTDMALCTDLLVIADDARIGYPPARVWGVPDVDAVGAQDRRPAREAAAVHRRPDHRRRRRSTGASRSRRRRPPSSTPRFEALVQRIAQVPVNQLVMMKPPLNQAAWSQGLRGDAGARRGLRRRRPPHA